jgi:DNA-directed RNA polymerase specialized sigma24 family protein
LVIEVVELDLGAPDAPAAPDFPDREAKGKVIVDEDDMVFVARSKRGRPRKLSDPDALQRMVDLYFVERLSMRKVAELMGVSHMSVYRLLSDPDLRLLI